MFSEEKPDLNLSISVHFSLLFSMTTTFLLFYTFFKETISKIFVLVTSENAIALSRDLGPRSASPVPIIYQLCDLEYVTHPLWAVYLIFKDLPALLFWDSITVSFTDQSLYHKDPIQKYHSEFSLVSRCLPADPFPQMLQAIWERYFESHHRWEE